jgi:hypothetical protein
VPEPGAFAVGDTFRLSHGTYSISGLEESHLNLTLEAGSWKKWQFGELVPLRGVWFKVDGLNLKTGSIRLKPHHYTGAWKDGRQGTR